jgi:hypothetical protein
MPSYIVTAYCGKCSLNHPTGVELNWPEQIPPNKSIAEVFDGTVLPPEIAMMSRNRYGYSRPLPTPSAAGCPNRHARAGHTLSSSKLAIFDLRHTYRRVSARKALSQGLRQPVTFDTSNKPYAE